MDWLQVIGLPESDSSNGGLFRLIITQMIEAKDITITAAIFRVDTLCKFNKSVQNGALVSRSGRY